MWSFFHGWRRKAGLVTLVMALALMVMWIRSRVIVDGVTTVASPFQQEWYYSADGVIGWYSYETTLAIYTPAPNFIYATMPFKSGGFFDPKNPGNAQWRSRWFGGGVVEFPVPAVRTVNGSGAVLITLHYISYRSFVLPLTLISAYLILWKPRKAKQSDQISNINSN